MAGKKLGKKEIEQLLMEGWTVRTRKVKNKKYLTIRKRNQEKGLGPFNEETYREISSMQKSLQLVASARETIVFKSTDNGTFTQEDTVEERQGLFAEQLDKQLAGIQLYRGAYKLTNCVNKHVGYCTFWNWKKREEIPSSLRMGTPLLEPDLREISIPKLEGSRWVVRATPAFCKYCSMFKQ
jgi:hypothetical protein